MFGFGGTDFRSPMDDTDCACAAVNRDEFDEDFGKKKTSVNVLWMQSDEVYDIRVYMVTYQVQVLFICHSSTYKVYRNEMSKQRSKNTTQIQRNTKKYNIPQKKVQLQNTRM